MSQWEYVVKEAPIMGSLEGYEPRRVLCYRVAHYQRRNSG